MVDPASEHHELIIDRWSDNPQIEALIPHFMRNWPTATSRPPSARLSPKQLASIRRQGICGTLVYRLSQLIAGVECGSGAFDGDGLGAARVTQLVMQADEDYHAARIYESIGFVRKERLGGLCVYDRATWGA